MPLDPNGKILLHLAGTVALPAAPPSGASIEILPPPDDEDAAEETYLRLTQHISLSVIIKWTVRLRDVSALAAPRESFPPDSPPERWPVGGGWAIRMAAEVERLAVAKIAGARSVAGEPLPWMAEAVIFVPESTPVLRQAESGLTASESVEFFPVPSVRLADQFSFGAGVQCLASGRRRRDGRHCLAEDDQPIGGGPNCLGGF